MNTTAMRGYCGRLSQVWFLLGFLVAALPLSAKTFRVYVTNHAGDTVDVIDPATNKIVQVIENVEVPHDVSFSPDGSRVYISIESENVLDVVDRETGKIIKKVALSGRPNTIAVTKNGGRVFVGIRSWPGVLDVIDTSSFERVKSIPDTGPLHDIYLTPDGKYVVAGSLIGPEFLYHAQGEFSAVCIPRKSRLAAISLANSWGVLSPRAR